MDADAERDTLLSGLRNDQSDKHGERRSHDLYSTVCSANPGAGDGYSDLGCGHNKIRGGHSYSCASYRCHRFPIERECQRERNAAIHRDGDE